MQQQISELALQRLADKVEDAIERAAGQRVDVEIDPVKGTLFVSIGAGGPSVTLSPGPGLMRRVMAFAASVGRRFWRWLF